MDPAKLQEIVLANQRCLATFDEWGASIERRVTALEKNGDVLVDVRLSLEKLTSSNVRLAEKLHEMKNVLEKIEEDNKAQHQQLDDRLKKLEDAPGDKWNKAIWILVTGALMAASSGLTKLFTP